MSTTEPPTQTQTSSVPASSTTGTYFTDNGSPPSHSNGSSSLYLFTFLATLFLLLFVSCAIVLRSFILRRRFRRNMEEAIAAGVMFPGPQGGYRKRKFGDKPMIWDVWVSPSAETWEDMKPVGAKILSFNVNSSLKQGDASGMLDDPQNSDNSGTRFGRTLRRQFTRRPSAHASPSLSLSALSSRVPTTPTSQSNTGQGTMDEGPPQLQVSVLIHMPSPYRSHAGSTTLKGKERSADGQWDDDEFPDVVIGVTEELGKET